MAVAEQTYSKMQAPYVDQVCDTCHYGTYQVPLSGQEWHLTCNECETILFCYAPMPHQYDFHADPHKYRLFAGGYGSAKTTTACAETIDHILTTPRGTTLIGAATLPQLENTAQKEFFEMFPSELIKSYSKQKNYLDTKNGHRVIFRPFDDEQKARSLNLSFFWIEEANGVGFEYFTQLQTRLRNKATEHHKGVLSSNPDQNWIKTEILLKADKIYNSEEEYHRTEINKDISVHIAPTHLNIYLPDDYFESTSRGKEEWWVRRYLYGSFQNKEGLVYPQAMDHVVEPFEIPTHWEKYMAVDYGLQDPTAVIWAAVDPKSGIVYFYDEHYENQKPVHYHATKINERNSKIPFGLLNQPIGDSSGKQTSETDMRSTFDHYAEYGIYFKAATRKLEDSIMKMYGYYELGKIKIFSNLKNFLKEVQNYKYPERELDSTKNINYEKPLDKNNHLQDAGRYLVAELPDDPNDLVNLSYNANFEVYNSRRESTSIPHALQTDDTDDVKDWLHFY